MTLITNIPSEFLPLPYKETGLYFDFNSAAKIKEWAGCNVIAGDNPLGTLVDDPTADKGKRLLMDPLLLRAMLAACLYRVYRKITPDDAGAMIRPDNMAAVTEGVMRAFAAFFGKTLEDLMEDDPTENPTTETTTPPSV